MKLALGTAQFGLEYGITNAAGRVPVVVVEAILKAAQRRAVSMIDTARSYGEAEVVLGSCGPLLNGFAVVTKIPALPDRIDARGLELWLDERLQESRQALGRDALDVLLVHKAQDLCSCRGDQLWAALARERDRGRVGKLGASVYTGEEIDLLLNRYELEVVQLPINILDQRLLKSDHLRRLKARGVEVHARSVFLQGLLLVEPSRLSPAFGSARPTIVQLREYCNQNGITPLQAAVAFVAGIREIDRVVVGVTTEVEFEEVADAFAGDAATDPADFAFFKVEDDAILNPSRWPSLS